MLKIWLKLVLQGAARASRACPCLKKVVWTTRHANDSSDRLEPARGFSKKFLIFSRGPQKKIRIPLTLNYKSNWIVATIRLVVDDRLSVLLRLRTARRLAVRFASAPHRPSAAVRSLLPTHPRPSALFFARFLASRPPPAPAWS